MRCTASRRVNLLHQFITAEGAEDLETSAESLDGGESITLVVGCNFCRGYQPDSERERPGNRGSVSSRGVVIDQKKHDGDSEPARETTDGGVESGGPVTDSLGKIRLNSCDYPGSSPECGSWFGRRSGLSLLRRIRRAT